ncbi:hypothetical protein DSECCO2_653070 [anaerobic digester metagenome]
MGKDVRVRLKINRCTGFFRFTYFLNRIFGFANGVFLLVYFAITANGYTHMRRQGVYAGYAHPVQSAGNLIGAFVKLTTGMQNGHNHFECRTVFFFMQINRYAPSIV